MKKKFTEEEIAKDIQMDMVVSIFRDIAKKHDLEEFTVTSKDHEKENYHITCKRVPNKPMEISQFSTDIVVEALTEAGKALVFKKRALKDNSKVTREQILDMAHAIVWCKFFENEEMLGRKVTSIFLVDTIKLFYGLTDDNESYDLLMKEVDRKIKHVDKLVDN